MSPPAETATANTVDACPKCGTIEPSGTLSCCAPDGAWAQKCGGADDPDFEHTWFQGTQACEGSVKSFAGEVQSQILRRHEGTATQHLNVDRQQRDSGVSDVDITDSTGCHKLKEVYMLINILLMILNSLYIHI